MFGFGQLDHVQRNDFGLGCLGSSLAGVALIDAGDLDQLTRSILDVGGHVTDHGSVADISRVI